MPGTRIGGGLPFDAAHVAGFAVWPGSGAHVHREAGAFERGPRVTRRAGHTPHEDLTLTIDGDRHTPFPLARAGFRGRVRDSPAWDGEESEQDGERREKWHTRILRVSPRTRTVRISRKFVSRFTRKEGNVGEMPENDRLRGLARSSKQAKDVFLSRITWRGGADFVRMITVYSGSLKGFRA